MNPPRSFRRQRGAAALVVTLMLFLVLALSMVYANRALLVDTRSVSIQVQTSQAFEAAEAGIEWATALLDDPHRLDETCVATSLASARSLRDRWLTFDPVTGAVVPRVWIDGAVARPLQAICVGTATGWQCSCPSSGPPHPPAATGTTTRPSFRVALQAGGPPGTVEVSATGCNNRGVSCTQDSSDPAEGKAQAQSLLALLPAVFTAPAATLTTRGDIAVTGSAFTVSNTDLASGGTVIDAGGSFSAPGPQLTSVPGAAAALSAVEGDAALHGLSADRLFARHFGMDRQTWRQRPGVVRIACAASCGPQVDAALATGASMVYVDGNLRVDGVVNWGSAARPVVIVAAGEISISGAGSINGVLYGDGMVWDDAAPGTASLHGALISEGGFRGTGSPSLFYDRGILHTLNASTGSFVRVPGSWKDF